MDHDNINQITMDKDDLIECINEWLDTERNGVYDMRGREGEWEITITNPFEDIVGSAIPFQEAVQHLRTVNPINTTVLNLRMSRDLLARVIFIYRGHLERGDVANLLPTGASLGPDNLGTRVMMDELVRVSRDGAVAILKKVFMWLLEDEEVDEEEQTKCKRVLHMFRMRLVYAAEAVYTDMIVGGVIMDPGYNAGQTAEAAAVWRRTFTNFSAHARYHIALREWPVRAELVYHRAQGGRGEIRR
ncbi:hypothetical protein F5884DRAFT_849740 [Xylogone sp. PMI_703]|nr:hypothetical protein F5884DRAFT_849740 [Xylogone sp. PMI_703]